MNATSSLIQRALTAHQERIQATEDIKRSQVHSAREVAVGLIRDVLGTSPAPGEIQIALPDEQNDHTQAFFVTEKLSFKLVFHPDKPDVLPLLSLCVGNVYYNVECLADLGAQLWRLNLAPNPTPVPTPAPEAESGAS